MATKLYKSLTDYVRVNNEAEEQAALRDGYKDVSEILGKGNPASPEGSPGAPKPFQKYPSKLYKSLKDSVRVANKEEAVAALKKGYKDIQYILHPEMEPEKLPKPEKKEPVSEPIPEAKEEDAPIPVEEPIPEKKAKKPAAKRKPAKKKKAKKKAKYCLPHCN